ncbi:COPZ1, partial [Cervus elaphus hippelaphus]
QEPSLYTVKAILILDNDGDRLFAKYYDDTYPSVKEQKAFEKNIFNKTHRTDSEIALLEGLTVVYKSSIDLYFYVIGSSYENEVRIPTLYHLCSHLLNRWQDLVTGSGPKDCRVPLASDWLMKLSEIHGEDVPLTEQTVSQVLQSAKEQIKWSLLR